MPTIFYDVDGVLHPYDTGSLSCQEILVGICETHPEIQLVMSSNWRESMDIDYFKNNFHPKIVDKTIGFTPCLPDSNFARQAEVEAFVSHFHIKNFVCLDDLQELFSPSYGRLFLADRSSGLKPSDVPLILSKLNLF